MKQNSTSSDFFRMDGWDMLPEQATINFHFTCSKFGPFQECVRFPDLQETFPNESDTGVESLIALLQIAVGVSYYKCAAAPHIILPPGVENATAIAMAEEIYNDGLAEFYVRADLPYPPDLTFSRQAPTSTKAHRSFTPPRKCDLALVAFGGGKDSYVADAIINKSDTQTQLCSVVMSEKVRNTIQATAPKPVMFLWRELDSKLREVNKLGAHNGHVPITAINSLILVIYGHLIGAKQVIFANERSADEPTINCNSLTANHQYSKSSYFEKTLREAIRKAAPHAPEYFSILRPFSELWIAEKFSKLKTPFSRFTSCNKNFQITGEASPRWCGACAKCAFTSLLIAPHLTEIEMKNIFPNNFLNAENLIPIYQELCGLTDNKPWDCVGTINECRATLYRLSQHPLWQKTLSVDKLLPQIMKQNTAEQLEAYWEEGFNTSNRHFLPDSILETAHDL